MLPKADAVADAWALPDELTLRQASSTLARLLGALTALPRGRAGRIDAAPLSVFGSPALAVLLECRRSALATGRAFAVDGLPVALGGLAALYGVEALLNAPA